MKIYERIHEMEKLEQIEENYLYRRMGIKPSLFGSQFCFANDGDYMTVDEVREALEQIVSEFGGSIKWAKAQKAVK